MSKNQHLPLAGSNKKTDARVRRTRDALGDALIALMQEKAFETITVQEVLDRAHVSRSTFYTHYSDKDDLLMSDAEEFFESISQTLSVCGDQSDRVFPVREFFSHITEAKQFVEANNWSYDFVGAGRLPGVLDKEYERLKAMLVELGLVK